jgi:peptide/nickel transport system substrate-binding protein
MRLRMFARTIALVAIVGIVAAACGGDDGGTTVTTPPDQVTKGGEIVVAAEQWPECISPITQCGAATWTWYSVLEQVLPYAMVLDLQGNFVASPTLSEAPTLDNGGLTQDPFTVTFRISPEAVWEDGSPITSKDFDFTWKAIMNTTGAYNQAGYSEIESIDTTDPATATIAFKSVYVDWPDLFGGVYQGIFKAAAFPEFADSDTPNLENEMLDNMPFSGGPFVLDSWSADQAVFSANPNCFGRCPNLDGFTIVPRIDQATEINSLLTGEVSAIYPQPSDVSLIDQVASNPNVKAVGSDGAYFEALWFNHEAEPVNDLAVRQAIGYAVDRQAVIDAIIKLNNQNAAVLTCGFVAFPHIGEWCSTQYFEEFTYDPAKAKEILTGAGYDCSAEGEACTKDGEPLVVQYSTVSTNTRRTTTQELLKDKALDAGIEFRIKNYDAGILFGDIGPGGKYDMADYATGGSVDPSITGSFGCDAVPTETDPGGANWQRWCNEEADALMKQSDTELDSGGRLDLLNQVYALEEQDMLSLPLYVLPNVGAWRTDKITGPIDSYVPSNLGMFYNIWEWSIVE